MNLSLNDKKTNRQARLDAWFILNGIEKRTVAEHLGVCPQRFSQIIRGHYTKKQHIQELISIGIPEELLPSPHNKQKSGPKANKNH